MSIQIKPSNFIANNNHNLLTMDPRNDFGIKEDQISKEFENIKSEIGLYQYKLFAEKKKALLIVLQGMDASGKDGVIRNVMNAFNPAGCRIESFKTPNSEELSYDYLWRVHKKIPGKGIIAVFNRSHYEDVIEVRVQKLKEKTIWEKRYQQINDFEKYLTENDIEIIKIFLNISKEEQKKRLDDRINDPKENWKVSMDDYQRRKKWDRYIYAYSDVIKKCNTKYAPWYLVPADKKWFRNLIIAKIIQEKLEVINPKFPVQKFKIPTSS
ncbi:MAG: polyphosphate kinase [Nitrososphaeraceae archaeon]|nr:polyphosphate kinase [Nitrososphaeraceae archaeon]